MMHAVGLKMAGAGSESERKEAPSTRCTVPCRMFCQATGFGGTVQEGRSVEDKLRAREERPDAAVEAAAAAREIIVSFNADVADGMPWRFVPAQRSVKASLCMGSVGPSSACCASSPSDALMSGSSRKSSGILLGDCVRHAVLRSMAVLCCLHLHCTPLLQPSARCRRHLTACDVRQVHPGQSTLVFYTAHNASDKAITGVSTYNVAPQQAGYYFNKIQCFCFEEQKLRPGASLAAPCLQHVLQ